MKIISYNVRGMGKKMKISEIKQMIQRNSIDMCCIQESKMEKFEDRIGREIWVDNNFDLAWREEEGRSGGIISKWDQNTFSKTSSWHIKGMLVVNGKWREDDAEVVIINVYAPCLVTEKNNYGIQSRLL
ncbi:hypothetical protein ACS0TY_024176 [Phlomoides rotata]